jgi:hypothetical protein
VFPDVVDTRTFSLGNSFTIKQFYKFMFNVVPSDPAFNDIWKSIFLPKLRVFAWLLMMDRLG